MMKPFSKKTTINLVINYVHSNKSIEVTGYDYRDFFIHDDVDERYVPEGKRKMPNWRVTHKYSGRYINSLFRDFTNKKRLTLKDIKKYLPLVYSVRTGRHSPIWENSDPLKEMNLEDKNIWRSELVKASKTVS